ncbi:hypothetical protein J6590_095721, partial [Homalodisca vitripennis]
MLQKLFPADPACRIRHTLEVTYNKTDQAVGARSFDKGVKEFQELIKQSHLNQDFMLKLTIVLASVGH